MAKSHIARLNELTELEVSKLTSTTVDETALAILKRLGSLGIIIASLQKTFQLDGSLIPILTQLTDRTLQTGHNGLSNCRISPRYLEMQRYIPICFGLYSMEWNIKQRATMVI